MTNGTNTLPIYIEYLIVFIKLIVIRYGYRIIYIIRAIRYNRYVSIYTNASIYAIIAIRLYISKARNIYKAAWENVYWYGII